MEANKYYITRKQMDVMSHLLSRTTDPVISRHIREILQTIEDKQAIQ